MTAERRAKASGGSAAGTARRVAAARASESPIRVLLVEDVPAEAELTIRQLCRGGLRLEWLRVDTEESFAAALHEFRPHVVLSDFTLPEFSGLAALKVASKLARHVPFIFVSGTIGEERAIEALR